MNPNPVWPSTSSEIVLWTQVLSVWLVAAYVTTPRLDGDARSMTLEHSAAVFGTFLLVCAGGWFLPPPGSSRLLRVVLTTALAVATSASLVTRRRFGIEARTQSLAVWEIGINVFCGIATGVAIGASQVGSLSSSAFIRSPKVAAVACVIAAISFVFRGGTYIVRSVLDRTGAVPPLAKRTTSSTTERTRDASELNRGRAIGNIERLLMLIVISLGSYEALGFLVAAKGLIRAREFENRDFAEYFILGSLTSVAVALVTGILLRAAVNYLWAL